MKKPGKKNRCKSFRKVKGCVVIFLIWININAIPCEKITVDAQTGNGMSIDIAIIR